MIGIINYGSGNIQAIATIYKRLNIDSFIIHDPEQLKTASKLILPGVGAFDATMRQLEKSGLKNELDEQVLQARKPILGICVGLQVMGFGSEEGDVPGLGWIPGKVRKFDPKSLSVKPKFPHMGWNTIADEKKHWLFSGIDFDFGFYFVHSYYFECDQQENILATTEYGHKFTSAITHENIIGVQFHPEKSHENGIQLFKNFALK